MIDRANGENRTGERNTSHPLSLLVVRLVMGTSWAAALALAWMTVVSPDIRWRFVATFMSVLVLAPTLVLAYRQTSAEEPSVATREHVKIEPVVPEQDSVTRHGEGGAYVDQPTGLASKRYLNMFLKRELNRSQRAGTALSVVVFDIDEFSRLADKAGVDAAITGVADVGARLKSALREYDLVARYSSGRLTLVLPETNARAASEVVERLHSLATTVCISGKPLSVSVGLATYPENGSTAEDLINSAHRELNRGRVGSGEIRMVDGMRKAS